MTATIGFNRESFARLDMPLATWAQDELFYSLREFLITRGFFLSDMKAVLAHLDPPQAGWFQATVREYDGHLKPESLEYKQVHYTITILLHGEDIKSRIETTYISGVPWPDAPLPDSVIQEIPKLIAEWMDTLVANEGETSC